jgi:DEAD/DEAH box helicase domain-containing protein
MSVQKLLSRWRSDPEVGGNVVVWQAMPARQPQFEDLPTDLHPALARALRSTGVQRLYSHQAASWQHLRQGRNIVVVTGTASGKTLCYNLPILQRLLEDPQARSLYLFPTKALAQDQVSALHHLVSAMESHDPRLEGSLIASVYDGDTPSSARATIRKNARLVFSNPDMLHTGILPHHTNWVEFFSNLRFVVLDEVHTYRGVFGSHVANVLRRLKRIARFYGADPQFVLTSATIANPSELAERLVEAPVELLDQDGSVRGPKTFMIYNPPVVDARLGLRRSALTESVRLADDLLAYGVQTILFARSRRSVELILSYLRQNEAAAPWRTGENVPLQESLRGYRSGYLPRQRREIEKGLRSGQVRSVVATNALELGIDIGGMGAAVLVGYPGSIAGTWQQAGRAGRGDQPSLAVLVSTADPLDQFLAHHPEYFFARSPEQALINPDNLLILLGHLRCAAFELPFHRGEGFGRVSSQQVAEFLSFLEAQGDLHASNDRFFWMADQYPAQDISLRSASANNVVLQAEQDGELFTLGQVDEGSAHWMVHPQAIYLHEGRSFIVENLDLTGHLASLRPIEPDYYTIPSQETTVTLLEQLQESAIPGGRRSYGEVQVTSQVTGYRKVRWYTHEHLGAGDVDLPPVELQTTAYWLALDENTVDRLRQDGLWRGDPNQYGPNWGQQRNLARQRDGYTCQLCGASESGREHDVHHKLPFRTFTSYLEANQLENLITLCHPCHRRVETAVRVRSGLAGLGYVLGQLAPLFLMCDGRDLGVHTDPQSPLSDGQPTVVLYDQVPAGIGLSQRLYEIHGDLVQRAAELVASCACTDGCPSCVGPGGENGLGGKSETLAILNALLLAGTGEASTS